MTKKKFELRIRNKQWDEDDSKSSWWNSSSEDTYIGLGKTLVDAGFSYKGALSLLGSAHYAVSAEYGE
ncbi:MAG TPA: hypothetical protein VFG06_06060 [Thermodesulfovibrionales bacterium]|nr:hypothetical protein [Thermodesulfovibrionales bacterium]